jgi:hypothetical protein
MRIHKSLLLSLIFSLFLTSVTTAAEIPPSADINTSTSSSNIVATVNIEDAKIVSQKGNIFKISFTLSNREGLQTGVKYGVKLFSDTGKYLADEKVYEESLTLYENSKVEKEITYVAPSVLSGSYTVYLASNNENNFPFGIVEVGKAKLVASIKGIEIQNTSCYLQVVGEVGNTHYSLIKSTIDIAQNEQLRLTCTAVNKANTSMTVVPYYETHYFSAYGKVAPQEGGDYKSITFAKGEKKTFSVILPKSNTAQFYNLKIGLLSSDTSSNFVSVGYIIRGVSGAIQKISLDKNYYKGGDKGEMTVLWYASSGDLFTRSKSKVGIPPNALLSAIMVNEEGRDCINSINKQPLTRDTEDSFTHIAFNIKTTCMNPKVKATLTDESGRVLDQKEFAFKSDPASEAVIAHNAKKSMSPRSAIILVVALLAIVGAGIYMKKKKGANI